MRKLLATLASAIVTLALAVGGTVAAPPAQAANAGDSLTTATPLAFGSTFNGSISQSNTTDVFKIDLPSSGAVTISFTSVAKWVSLTLYDMDYGTVWGDQANYDYSLKMSSYSRTTYLVKGVHYLGVGRYWSSIGLDAGPEFDGAYSLKVTFTSSNESFTDLQDREKLPSAANVISLGNQYRGQLSEIKVSNRSTVRYTADRSVDYYTFTLASKMNLAFDAGVSLVCGPDGDYAEMELRSADPSINTSLLDRIVFSGETYSKTITTVPAGKYYFIVTNSGGSSFAYTECGGVYQFRFDQLQKVTFNVNGGKTLASGKASKTVVKGAKVGTLPTPSRTGYTFQGWYTAKSGGSKIATTSVVTKNVTYYAHWKAKTYTVKFNVNGGKKLAASKASKKVTYASKYGALPTPTRTKYTFKGWHTAKSGGTKITSASKVKITKTTTLYAQWKKK